MRERERERSGGAKTETGKWVYIGGKKERFVKKRGHADEATKNNDFRHNENKMMLFILLNYLYVSCEIFPQTNT